MYHVLSDNTLWILVRDHQDMSTRTMDAIFKYTKLFDARTPSAKDLNQLTRGALNPDMVLSARDIAPTYGTPKERLGKKLSETTRA
jgi:hypothetical protein